jgi:hypothetical protein
VKRKWTRRPRFYDYGSQQAQAFIFGAPPPRQMWAWVVYFKGGSCTQGVESSMARAFRCAEEKLDAQEFGVKEKV